MKTLTTCLVALSLFAAACTQETPAPAPGAGGPLAAFVAPAAPGAAKSVLELRKSAAAGDEVSVVGRAKDFVGGRAAFTLIDSSLRACSDEGDPMEDSCETPWDYCCIDPQEVTAACATIEVRDAAGVIKAPVQGVSGLDHLDTVYVNGVVEKDASGNLTVVAKSFHVKPSAK
jgi:hypothetical protein